MSGRRAQSLAPHVVDRKPTRGRFIAAICFSWKVITCIVSHVTLVLLVVSYCVGGAYLFQKLERPHEIEVKTGIQNMRKNLTDKIWKFSDNSTFLSETIWMEGVSPYLAVFENEILTAMKKDGWDGDENVTLSQWTFVGSLFYSIIVITTIGYGHISPHTDWGKVTTIFYAIVGIPLMLLCLSNIGDVMATSFRFLYWRVCCFVCTRTSKRTRHRSRQRSMRGHRYSSHSQPLSFRRSMKLTQRSAADSGVGPSIGLPHAYSDPELRNIGRSDYDFEKHHQQNLPPIPRKDRLVIPYEEDFHARNSTHIQNFNRESRGSRFTGRQRHRSYARDRHTIERERHFSRSKQQFDSMNELNIQSTSAKRSLSMRSVRSTNLRHDQQKEEEQNSVLSQPLPRGRSLPNTNRVRAKSVDPRVTANYEEVDEDVIRKTPIISNRYVIHELDYSYNRTKSNTRSQSMPRSVHHKQKLVQSTHSPRSFQKHPLSFNQHSAQISRYGNHLELPEISPQYIHKTTKSIITPHSDDQDNELHYSYLKEQEDGEIYNHSTPSQPYRERRQRRDRTERLPPSPRIMSPMGFAVKRQVRRRPSFDRDDDSFGDEWSEYYGDISPKDRPVPIWLCVFLVISYILGGAALFAHWEDWTFLDSAYFCFITLTTIGFGDFVPAKGVKDESEQSIAYCSLYLLFGIALLAMSFNLVQEEFIANVKEVARRLGILKDEEDDD